MRDNLLIFGLSLTLIGCAANKPQDPEPLGALPSAVTTAEPLWIPAKIRAGHGVYADPRETRLLQLRRLTSDGTSGAAVWHPDSLRILYESGRGADSCGQLYSMDLGSGQTRRVSPETGWASSGAFAADSGQLLFVFAETPSPPCMPFGTELRWTLPRCDIVRAAPGGVPTTLVQSPAYDAELSATRDGSRIVFTSMRDGDPELYVAAGDGSDLRRITTTAGYDGGASYSPDNSKLVWQAERLSDEAIDAYKEQLAAGNLMPRSLHIVIAGAHGQHPRVIADSGHYNITPSFLPDSRHVLFASDVDDVPATGGPRNFELYVVDTDGPITATGGPRVERVSFSEGYDGDASISPDGRYVLFTSSRFADKPGGTDLFVARWRAD